MAELQRRTFVDQIEIRRDGTVQVRLMKAIVEGEAIVAQDYHRFVVEPGCDADEQVAAVNAHLAQMGEATVEDAEIDRLRRIATVEHTPERIAAYRAKTSTAETTASPSCELSIGCPSGSDRGC